MDAKARRRATVKCRYRIYDYCLRKERKTAYRLASCCGREMCKEYEEKGEDGQNGR